MAKSIKQKDINLIVAMTRVVKDPGKGKNARLAVLLIILVVIILAGATVFVTSEKNKLEDQKVELNLYLNDQANVEAHRKAVEAQSKFNDMLSQTNSLEQVLLNISSNPVLTSANINTIYELAKNRVELSDFAFDTKTGVVSFNATCSTPTVIPTFVSQLRSSDMFEDVLYQGYSGTIGGPSSDFSVDPLTGQQINSPITPDKFTFAVSCLMVSPTPTLPTTPVVAPE